MVNATNKVIHRVFVGRTEEKLAAVAAARSPYFFFEAETEDEALQIAQRALNFYFENPTEWTTPTPVKKTQPSISRFRKTRTEEIRVQA